MSQGGSANQFKQSFGAQVGMPDVPIGLFLFKQFKSFFALK